MYYIKFVAACFVESPQRDMEAGSAAVPQQPAHADDYNASYRDNIWLSQFPLDHQSVLYYFAGSPWYDKNCNNEILKMQRRPLEHLQGMTGIEYELQPNDAKQVPQILYVIHKKNRTGPRTAHVMAVYYVLDATIYQAPNTYTLLTSRLVQLAVKLKRKFEKEEKIKQNSARVDSILFGLIKKVCIEYVLMATARW
ncbi:hypothetical protein DYB32_003934 [Aphanomyces invadans]|uniref:Mediator of RNA polymerase II transcription subunit 6 n=1 Tax=Aphanomyces invadans TaxID=157072 RepID=A0A418AYZ7_9STRA|nr:hypothetical protein DYB32_003934 [Aphanomyces invadans]